MVLWRESPWHGWLMPIQPLNFITLPTIGLHSGTPALEQGIRPAPLVENISKAMATPLGFISNHWTAPDQSQRPGERLVFLGHDNFICSVPIHPANREYAITQHLPLPDHWCLPEKLQLYQMILGDIYILVSDQVLIIKNVFWGRNIWSVWQHWIYLYKWAQY